MVSFRDFEKNAPSGPVQFGIRYTTYLSATRDKITKQNGICFAGSIVR